MVKRAEYHLQKLPLERRNGGSRVLIALSYSDTQKQNSKATHLVCMNPDKSRINVTMLFVTFKIQLPGLRELLVYTK